MMNKSKAIKNSECYYELNMLNLLLKMNLLTEEEYKSILDGTMCQTLNGKLQKHT